MLAQRQLLQESRSALQLVPSRGELDACCLCYFCCTYTPMERSSWMDTRTDVVAHQGARSARTCTLLARTYIGSDMGVFGETRRDALDVDTDNGI